MGPLSQNCRRRASFPQLSSCTPPTPPPTRTQRRPAPPRFDARVSERISISLNILMGRSSSKSELQRPFPVTDCQIRQGLLSTAHVAFEKFRSVVRGHRRVNPHLRTRTTVPVQLHERGADVITPYLQQFFDTSFRPPSPKSPVGRLWTSSGMCVGSSDRSSAKRMSSSYASITKSISGTKRGTYLAS